jgi:hypothetical protein
MDKKQIKKEAKDFAINYVEALNSHKFSNVKKLLTIRSPKYKYLGDILFFYFGNTVETVADLKIILEKHWKDIPNQKYKITKFEFKDGEVGGKYNLGWAMFNFYFDWQGEKNGKIVKVKSGAKNNLLYKNSKWKIYHQLLRFKIGR